MNESLDTKEGLLTDKKVSLPLCTSCEHRITHHTDGNGTFAPDKWSPTDSFWCHDCKRLCGFYQNVVA